MAKDFIATVLLLVHFSGCPGELSGDGYIGRFPAKRWRTNQLHTFRITRHSFTFTMIFFTYYDFLLAIQRSDLQLNKSQSSGWSVELVYWVGWSTLLFLSGGCWWNAVITGDLLQRFDDVVDARTCETLCEGDIDCVAYTYLGKLLKNNGIWIIVI